MIAGGWASACIPIYLFIFFNLNAICDYVKLRGKHPARSSLKSRRHAITVSLSAEPGMNAASTMETQGIGNTHTPGKFGPSKRVNGLFPEFAVEFSMSETVIACLRLFSEDRAGCFPLSQNSRISLSTRSRNPRCHY